MSENVSLPNVTSDCQLDVSSVASTRISFVTSSPSITSRVTSSAATDGDVDVSAGDDVTRQHDDITQQRDDVTPAVHDDVERQQKTKPSLQRQTTFDDLTEETDDDDDDKALTFSVDQTGSDVMPSESHVISNAAAKWKTVSNFFRTTRRVIPSAQHSVGEAAGDANEHRKSRDAATRRSSMQRRDSLLEKLSVPMSASDDDNDRQRLAEEGKQRFAFSRGIPITGSDDETFARQRCYKVVLNPESRILYAWLAVVTASWGYNVWCLIVRQAFRELREYNSGMWLALDYTCVAVYLLDIGVQLRTGFLENGLLVFDSYKLSRNYVFSKHFAFDILSLLPLDLLFFVTGQRQPLYFATRFLKAYRAKQFYRKTESLTSYPNAWRVLILCHTLMLIMHWFACFYYMISESEDFYLPPGQQRGWAYPLPRGGNDTEWSTLRRKYLHSIYWSCLTLTTIGEKQSPSTDIQYLCTLAAYFLGIFVFATVVGQVGNVIANKNNERLEYEKMVDQAKTFMKTKSIPSEMQQRVLRWYDYSWAHGSVRGVNDVNGLGMMPDTLKVELAIHMNLNTLRKVSIFRLVQPEFLYHLVLHLKSFIFTPGDLVCRQGEVAREMYIINHGVLEVVSDSGTVMAQLHAGDFFGEIGILNIEKGFNKRMANVRSVGYSEVFSLSRDHVLQAMEYYPEARDLLLVYGRQRLHNSTRQKSEEEAAKKINASRRCSASQQSRDRKRRSTSSSIGSSSITKSTLASVVTHCGLEFLPVLETLYDTNEQEEIDKNHKDHGKTNEQASRPQPNLDEKYQQVRQKPATNHQPTQDSTLHEHQPPSHLQLLVEEQKNLLSEKDKTIATLQNDVKLLVDKLQESMKQQRPAKFTKQHSMTSRKSKVSLTESIVSSSTAAFGYDKNPPA